MGGSNDTVTAGEAVRYGVQRQLIICQQRFLCRLGHQPNQRAALVIYLCL